jgi:hypothetical protein
VTKIVSGHAGSFDSVLGRRESEDDASLGTRGLPSKFHILTAATSLGVNGPIAAAADAEGDERHPGRPGRFPIDAAPAGGGVIAKVWKGTARLGTVRRRSCRYRSA